MKSQRSSASRHDKENVPFLLAGVASRAVASWTAGGSTPHSNLLVSILNQFGDTRTTFGDAEFCQNPLPSLTG